MIIKKLFTAIILLLSLPIVCHAEEKPVGWDPFLDIAANFSLMDSRNVISKQEGTTINIGFNIKGKMDYRKGPSEWLNSLEIIGGFTRTPALEEFVKGDDLLKLESLYLYSIGKTWGAFAQGVLKTSIFEGNEITPDLKIYIRSDEASPETTDKLKLTDPFQPLILEEAAGLFYRPWNKKELTAEFMIGPAGNQVIADGQYVIDDNGNTPDVIEVRELKNYAQFGGKAAARLNGEIQLKSQITYSVLAEAMMPFVYDDDENRDPPELTNYNFAASLSTKLTDWLSVNYEFKALKQPQLIDEWQVSNNLMISLHYIFVD